MTTAAASQGSDFSHTSPSRAAPSRSYSTRSSRPPPVPSGSAGGAAGPPASSISSANASANTNANSHSYYHHSSHQAAQQQQQQQQPGVQQQQQQQQQQQYATTSTTASSQQQPQARHRRRSSSSSSRPTHAHSQPASSQNDYETSHLAASQSKRSSSRDRPPLSSNNRAADASRSHRRSTSTRSTHTRQGHAEMPPSAVANNGSSAAASHHTSHGTADATHKQSRSRTTIPTQSGKWILGKTIGAGSMGKVKLARKEDGSEQVACKIIPRGSTDDGHQSRAEKERADQSKEIRTAREAAIVTLLHHPHICGMRDVVRTNYHWYMLFEYVNGGQMLDYIISHGKLKEKQARKFSRQIASALDYCHRNSIVHRDLKIENILISKTGDIKIIDFGLSNLFSPRGHLKTFCGSLYFAAPELLQARAYTGPEVDVWSFGIVLYVLVCGKVPFDDQSMPALHAKIKKGLVDYPSWLSNECKHLMSRMLVTDPKQRATMQEVMSHPWMLKGFSGPPDNYLPIREPLSANLEPEVIHAMQGFNFGSPEAIRAQLTKVIEAEDYQQAVKAYQREKEQPQPSKDSEKKRGFGFDFYKRRNSNSRDTLSGPSSEALQIGADPLNAFNPLTSIYYLVKEKQDREHAEMSPPASTSREKEKEKERELVKERERAEREREREKEKEREREKEKEKERAEREREREREKLPEIVPDLAPPQAAHTNAAAFEIPGERPTGGRTRPRARTHGEDDAPDLVKQQHIPVQPESKADQLQKKEGTTASLLRRFSTRKRREPDRSADKERDRSYPPMVHVHSPPEGGPTAPRKSFSIRRGRRDRDDHANIALPSGGSQHSELLSPPMSAGGIRGSRKSGLGRSTSVNSADIRRRDNAMSSREPPLTSGSDQSVTNDQSSTVQRSHTHSQSVAMRAKSLGHARRESVQQRRLRREAAQEANVPEETDLEQEASGVSTDRLDSAELAKPVYLKGLFSVSTTSGKTVPTIRADIRRVLKQLNVDYTEIRGGFSCKYTPSIDLNRVHDIPSSPPAQNQGGGHRRRFSFGGLMRGEDRDRDDIRDMDRSPVTPRTPGRQDRDRNRDRDRSYSNSEESVDSIPRRSGGVSRRVPGETTTQVQSDLGGSMVMEFEIFIVKVPLLSLHGIQFKRMTGNTWQYKNMAEQILKELKL